MPLPHHKHVKLTDRPRRGRPSPQAAGAGVRASLGSVAGLVTPRLREQLLETAEPVVAAQGCELVALEYRREPIGWTLRLYVERKGHDPRNAIGGVTLAECTRISRDLSTALDVAELIAHAFHLEVSSPGLERPLAKARDYARFVGLRARIHLREPVPAHPVRKSYRGELAAFSEERGGEVVLADDDVGTVTLPLEAITKAHLIDLLEPPAVLRDKRGPAKGPKSGAAAKGKAGPSPARGHADPQTPIVGGDRPDAAGSTERPTVSGEHPPSADPGGHSPSGDSGDNPRTPGTHARRPSC